MDNLRILITDQDPFIANHLAECLQNTFEVAVCLQSQKLLHFICEFEPDILLLDLSLPGSNVFDLLNTIRTLGNTVKVIATSVNCSDHVLAALEKLGVVQTISKPYRSEFLLSAIYAVAQNGYAWDEELEICRILGAMGFQLGTPRMRCVADAALRWYRADGDITTKRLYLEMAQQYAKTATGIEKTIRDAIHHAWDRGNRGLWEAYFLKQNTLNQRCPSNEVFIARMAHCLWTKERIRLPYKKAE